MDLVHGFVASRAFSDRRNFPYGFSKSGIFSIPESELLERLGTRLSSLEAGVVAPENDIEQNFMAVCVGEREAATKVESLWLKYKRNTHRKTLHTLGSNLHNSDDADGEDSLDIIDEDLA